MRGGIKIKLYTNTIISISDAKQNFSKITRTVDEHGSAIITQDNVPRYLVLDFKKVQEEQTLSNENIIAISRRVMKQNKEAYKVLAE